MKYLLLIVSIFIVMILIYQNITSIDKDVLLKGEKTLIVEYQNRTFIKDSSLIDYIFEDIQGWSISFATHAMIDEMRISSKNNNFVLHTFGNRILISYKIKYFEWIQLISKNEFPKFKQKILSQEMNLE